MQRRVRKHHPQPRRPRRHRCGNGRILAPPGEHDRALARMQQLQGRRLELDQHVRLGGHERERLVLTVLARAQARDGLLARRVAGEVVAAQALHREDLPGAQARHCFLERQGQTRSAHGTGDRLGVEAPVCGILVLTQAVGAEREAGHRRIPPVVGNGADDCEARAALRAVDERVAEAAVARVEELAQTVVAGGDVGGDQRRPGSRGALGDRERGVPERRQRLADNRVYPRQRRRFLLQPGAEGFQTGRIPLGLDHNPVTVVQNEAAERVAAGERVDEGAEPDALDDPGHTEAAALHAAIVALVCRKRHDRHPAEEARVRARRTHRGSRRGRLVARHCRGRAPARPSSRRGSRPPRCRVRARRCRGALGRPPLDAARSRLGERPRYYPGRLRSADRVVRPLPARAAAACIGSARRCPDRRTRNQAAHPVAARTFPHPRPRPRRGQTPSPAPPRPHRHPRPRASTAPVTPPGVRSRPRPRRRRVGRSGRPAARGDRGARDRHRRRCSSSRWGRHCRWPPCRRASATCSAVRRMRKRLDRLMPALAAASLAFGVWYALAASD